MLVPRQYSFGPFVFDANGHVLYRDAKDVGLPPKAAEVLALLLAEASSVVSKRALLDTVWAGSIVGDGALTRAMNILRKALGGDDANGTYIATISRRGYSFLAPVRLVAQAKPVGQQASIAVLPFDCLSADASQGHFSEGLTEEITAQLREQGGAWLRAIARISCTMFGKSPMRIIDIGRGLGVSYVLNGSVRGCRGRLRVAARLIQVSDEAHIWAENYECHVGNALRLRCALGEQIAQAVQRLFASQNASTGAST